MKMADRRRTVRETISKRWATACRLSALMNPGRQHGNIPEDSRRFGFRKLHSSLVEENLRNPQRVKFSLGADDKEDLFATDNHVAFLSP
ncbi:hypothetical protein CDAR_395141 [Caerostris darwini]|uniref:Uncharacterized protein n=1 Tax=Caerostris darwini TaxID=1538125 RepID=A0AAV4QEB4_9ARAC|nr:hypothetical protein CDAR_395141 [Caerostris darwini]